MLFEDRGYRIVVIHNFFNETNKEEGRGGGGGRVTRLINLP